MKKEDGGAEGDRTLYLAVDSRASRHLTSAPRETGVTKGLRSLLFAFTGRRAANAP